MLAPTMPAPMTTIDAVAGSAAMGSGVVGIGGGTGAWPSIAG